MKKKLQVTIEVNENKGEEYSAETYENIIFEAIMAQTTASVTSIEVNEED